MDNKKTKEKKEKNLNKKIIGKNSLDKEESEEENKVGEIEKVLRKNSFKDKNKKSLIRKNIDQPSNASFNDCGFNESLKKIDGLVAKIFFDNKTILFFSRLENNLIKSDEILIKFILYERDKIWSKIFSKIDFENLKNKMSLEGDWNSFFESFKKAIIKKNGGDISLKLLKDKKEKFNLILFHPITDDLKIKSEILFEDFIPEENIEFNKNSFQLCIDSVNFLEKKLSEKLNEENCFNHNATEGIINREKEFKNYSSKVSAELDFKKNTKRKFVSNLINPNLKKRKIQGNKLMYNSESSFDEEKD